MKINYGINRKLPRGRIEHRNGTLDFKMRWSRMSDHRKLRQEIARLNPGWSITGYARVEAKRDKSDVGEED